MPIRREGGLALPAAAQSEALCIAVLALLTIWNFPIWGERMIRLVEAWEDYRRRTNKPRV